MNFFFLLFSLQIVYNSDEIISVSSQKVTKIGDSNGYNGSPKFSDEIYLTDDYYGNTNAK